MECPKPVKGAHRKAKKAEHDAKMKQFRSEVMAADVGWECCNPFAVPHDIGPAPLGRSFFEAAHLVGRGRRFSNKPSNGMKLCWWCHDLLDQRHNEKWKELSADERKAKVLHWWKKYRPEHFDRRGWALPLKALENSVALKKVVT